MLSSNFPSPLPKASTATLGLVKPDGITLVVGSDGTLSVSNTASLNSPQSLTSWTTTNRPILAPGICAIGFNSSLVTIEYGVGQNNGSATWTSIGNASSTSTTQTSGTTSGGTTGGTTSGGTTSGGTTSGGTTSGGTTNSGTAVVQSVSGIPTTGTAYNPLAQGMIVYSNIQVAYACLYHNGADEGSRAAFGGGQLPGLTPQDSTGGSYTIRLYDAATGGNLFYESPAITISANQYRVGGSLAFTPTSTGAWKSTVASGGNLLNNDTYISANAPMSDATIYASTSMTIPPDQPGGSASVIGNRTHIVDNNNTRMYVDNLYVNGSGQVYVWVIAVSSIDGTTTRSILSTISPITVTSASSGTTGGGTTTGGATTSGGAAGSLAMSGVTYETGAPISGSGSLKTGSGSASLTLPAGATAMTVEGYIKAASGYAQQDPMLTIQSNGSGVSFGVGGDHNVRVSTGPYVQYNPALTPGLHHVALVWASYGSGAYHLFIDGTEVNTSGDTTQSTFPAAGGAALNVALPSDGSLLLDSLRVSGGARYTATFTPPNAPLAADATTLGIYQFNGNTNNG